MANPNLLNLTSIKLDNDVHTLGTSTGVLMAAASNQVIKIISLYLANKSAATVSATITATESSTTINLAYQVDIPPESTLQLITKDAPIVLTENDYISGLASAATSIDVFVSVEKME